VKRANLIYITRAHQITKKPTPDSPRRSFPSSRRGFEPPRPVVRARAKHPPARKNFISPSSGKNVKRNPGSRLLPSSLKQTHTEETQDGDDPHTSPFEIWNLKSCRTILCEILSYDPRVARASVEIGAHRRARVNGIPSSATATSSVEESKKNRRRV